MLLEQQSNKWGMGVKLGKHAQHIPPLRGPGGVIEAEESFQSALYFLVIPSNTPLVPLKGRIMVRRVEIDFHNASSICAIAFCA